MIWVNFTQFDLLLNFVFYCISYTYNVGM